MPNREEYHEWLLLIKAMKSHNPNIFSKWARTKLLPTKTADFWYKGCVQLWERVCMLPTKQLTYPEETNCLKLNKGPPFRTTIPHVLLHTIFMCVQISIWWTLMSQPVLVTGSPLNTQLRNHPFSWFVYKVCAMHAGWCMCVGVFTSSTKS